MSKQKIDSIMTQARIARRQTRVTASTPVVDQPPATYVDLAGGPLDADVGRHLADHALGLVIEANRLGRYLAKPGQPSKTHRSRAKTKTTRSPDSDAVYRAGRPLAADEFLAPQAQVICQVIQAHGELTKAQLLAKLEAALVTRQPTKRVLAWYQRELVDRGLLVMGR